MTPAEYISVLTELINSTHGAIWSGIDTLRVLKHNIGNTRIEGYFHDYEQFTEYISDKRLTKKQVQGILQTHLFIWENTPEGHEFWSDVFNSEDKSKRKKVKLTNKNKYTLKKKRG